MRLIYGVVLPLLIQLAIGITILFGGVIKTAGGSFVPLGVMLLSGPLVFLTFIFNLMRTFNKEAGHSTGSLFIRGLLTAMSVPVIMVILLVVGTAILD